MKNVKSVTTNHNDKFLLTATKPPSPTSRTCNCRKPISCQLEGKCLIKSTLYKADRKAKLRSGRKQCNLRNNEKLFILKADKNSLLSRRAVFQLAGKYCSAKFDIVEFYPSFTEDLLTKVMLWAKIFTAMPNEHISVIKHARNSLLFYGNNTWAKKSDSNSLFDVTMGSYGGAEVCELFGLYILERQSQECLKTK